ncbi:MAG: hypothetical protein ACK57N_11090 [Planctomycetia bacterium]
MARLMLYAPRTMSLVCELHHAALPHDPDAYERLHQSLRQGAQTPYAHLQLTPQGAIFANPPENGGASLATCLPDRIVFREELSSLTHDDFAARVRAVARQFCALRELGEYTQQTVTVRTLVNPQAFDDSRAYLKHAVFGFDDEIEAGFGRPAGLFGLRLVFPPTEDSAATHALRIESCAADPRSIYLEDHATFSGARNDGLLDAVEGNILETYRFVTESTMRFLATFDVVVPPPERDEAGEDQDEGAP